MGDGVVGEEAPAVPGHGLGGLLGVGGVLDEGDGPLEAVLVLEYRGVEGAGDAVGVALVADQRDGLADGADPPGILVQRTVPAGLLGAVGVGGSDFTDDVANVVVEAVELNDELIRLTVGVVVANGARCLAEVETVHSVGAPGLALRSWIARGRGSDDLDVGVRSLDGIEEHLEAV